MYFSIQSQKPRFIPVKSQNRTLASNYLAQSSVPRFRAKPVQAKNTLSFSNLFAGIFAYFKAFSNPSQAVQKSVPVFAVSSFPNPPTLQDRYMGALLGLAVGDALGCDIEDKSASDILRKNQGQKKTEITGGENGPPQKKYNNQPYRFRKGEMTDDTAMPIILGKALIQSLSQNKDLSTLTQRNQFLWNTLIGLDNWIIDGAQGTGGTTRHAARKANQIISNSPQSYLTIDPKTAGLSYGNGNAPLTRGIPLVLVFAKNKPKLIKLTEEACQISHQAPEAVAASVAYNLILADILNGKITNRSSLEHSYQAAVNSVQHISPEIAIDIHQSLQLKDYGTRKEYTDRQIRNALRISLWAFAQAFPKSNGQSAWNLETAVIEVANKGGDTDSNAAVTGALYGAYQGKWAVPKRWYNALLTQNRRDPNKPYLYYREDVEKMAKKLYHYRVNTHTSTVNPPLV